MRQSRARKPSPRANVHSCGVRGDRSHAVPCQYGTYVRYLLVVVGHFVARHDAMASSLRFVVALSPAAEHTERSGRLSVGCSATYHCGLVRHASNELMKARTVRSGTGRPILHTAPLHRTTNAQRGRKARNRTLQARHFNAKRRRKVELCTNCTAPGRGWHVGRDVHAPPTDTFFPAERPRMQVIVAFDRRQARSSQRLRAGQPARVKEQGRDTRLHDHASIWSAARRPAN